MRKYLFILISFAMALTLCTGAVSYFAVAQGGQTENQPVSPEIFNLNDEIIYGYLDNPSAINQNDGSIYITLENGVNVYKNFALTQSIDITGKQFTPYRDKNVYLDGTFLRFGDITLANAHRFAIDGDVLRTAYGDVITVYDLNSDLTLTSGVNYTAMGEVAAISKNGDYYAVSEDSNYDSHTIYRLAGGKHLLIDEFSQPILSLYSTQDFLYCLTESGITSYSIKDNVHTLSAQIQFRAKDFTVMGEKIYAISRMAQIIETDINLSYQKVVLASAAGADYFYNKPSSVSARFGNVIVSDRMNNRLAIIANNGEISYISVTRPIAASADSEGQIYVLTQNALLKLSPEGTIIKQVTMLGGIDVAVGSNDVIYVLTTEGIFTADLDLNLSADSTPATLMHISGGKLTYYDGESIFVNGEAIYTSQGITSYAIDASNKLFFIKNGALIRLDDSETEICKVDGKLIISGIKTEHIDYGDVLIANADRHCLYKINREQAGTANIEELYDIPQFSSEEAASLIKGNIIAKTLKNVKIFKTPAEAEIASQVEKDKHVIIYYEALCPEEFLYILYDDAEDLKLKGGYVYASAISQPLEYATPSITVGKINSDNTKIYKWPSIKSPTVSGISKNKNDTVSIIPFAVNLTDEYGKKWYQDGFGKKWYRTTIDDTHEGYIMASDISTEYYNNAKMPDTNAVITDYAIVYHYDTATQKYTPIDDLWIAKGSRVKVDVPFDSSQKYTKVVFYRDGYGTINIECYVETKYVEFDGIDLLQFVAILIIIVTVILAIILITKRVKMKRRNLALPNNRQ